MSKSRFESLTVRELRSEARKAGLTGYSTQTKSELVAALKALETDKAPSAKRTTKSKSPSPQTAKSTSARKSATPKKRSVRSLAPELREVASVTVHEAHVVDPKSATALPPEPSYEPFDEHVWLPQSYGKNRCTLMLKSPEWYFVYWDFDASLERNILGAGGKPALRFVRNGIRDKSFIDIMLLDRRHYVQVPGQDGQVKVELGGLFGSEFVVFLSSNSVDAMRSQPSKDDTIEFVIPEWLDTDASMPYKPMTRLEWEHLYGPVPVDVPWYKARKPKSR